MAFSFLVFACASLATWVAVGSTTTSQGAIATSGDGNTWTPRASPFNAGYAAAFSPRLDRWVAVGVGSVNTIAVSDVDGISWTGQGLSTFDDAFGVVWADGPDVFLALGRAGVDCMARSVNGLAWQGVGNRVFQNFGAAAAFNGSFWVAVGSSQASGSSIAWSRDAISWTGITPSLFTIAGYGVAAGSGASSGIWVRNGSLACLLRQIILFFQPRWRRDWATITLWRRLGMA